MYTAIFERVFIKQWSVCSFNINRLSIKIPTSLVRLQAEIKAQSTVSKEQELDVCQAEERPQRSLREIQLPALQHQPTQQSAQQMAQDRHRDSNIIFGDTSRAQRCCTSTATEMTNSVSLRKVSIIEDGDCANVYICEISMEI